jgi:hypothetical protein
LLLVAVAFECTVRSLDEDKWKNYVKLSGKKVLENFLRKFMRFTTKEIDDDVNFQSHLFGF